MKNLQRRFFLQEKAQGGGDIAVSKAHQSIQKEKTEPDHCQRCTDKTSGICEILFTF